MIDLKLDSVTHDLVVENNDLQLVEGSEQVKQNLLIRLQSFKNDWYLNVDIGLPYYEDILVKNPNISDIDAYFKAYILETDGVSELLEYSSILNTDPRILRVNFKYSDIYGNEQTVEIPQI